MSRCGVLVVLVVSMVGFSLGEAAEKADRGAFDRAAWETEVINRGLSPDEVVYPFGTTQEMTAWAEEAAKTATGFDPVHRLSRLQQAMFESGAFDFAYDETRTLTSEEAFAQRRGNCMSFTALFIAMSRSLGIQTYLLSVQREPNVERRDGLVTVNRHVVAGHRSGSQVATFDFYLSSEAPLISQQIVDDVRASAMFHTNLGGAALRADDLEEARRNLLIATGLAPEWAGGWINLGVALARSGDVDGAFDAYRRALAAAPGNSSALNNMSFLYRQLGRDAEAQVALRAAAETTESPFTLVAMADSELLRGNVRGAEQYLKKAKRRYPGEPEVYEGMARLARGLDQPQRAARYLEKAAKLERAQEVRRVR